MGVKRLRKKMAGFEIENIFNSISDFVSIHDREFKIVRANSALCTFLGQTEENLVGQTCYTVFHNRSSIWPGCPHALMEDKRKPVTELIDDSYIGIPLMVTCSPVHDENEQFLGSVHIARDVSLERNKEQDKDRIIADLQENVAHLKGLSGILTICASCKDIRNAEGEWERVEKFIADNSSAIFSHGICTRCSRKLYSEFGEF